MCDGRPDKANKEAAEGTTYHKVSELVLTGKAPSAAHYVGAVMEADGFEFRINEDDAEYAQGFIDRVRQREREGCIVLVEVKTDTSETLGIPEQTGTIDVRIFDIANETLEIRDLKFGRGVKVHVFDTAKRCDYCDGSGNFYSEKEFGRCSCFLSRVNDQLGIYGVSEWHRTKYMCEWKHLKLVIDQPRLNHYDEVTLSQQEVEAFTKAVNVDGRWSYSVWKSYHEDAKGLDVHLKPSLDACRWCPVGGACKVRADRILELIK